MNLYDILEEHRRLDAMLIESEGELTPEVEERLAINENDFKEKMEAYAKLSIEHNSFVSMIDEEVERLTAKRQTHNNIIGKLKSRMLDALMIYGTPDKKGVFKVDVGTFKFNTRKSSSIEITDESALPLDCWKIPEPKPTIDKVLLKQKIEAGEEVAGARIVNNYTLQMK